MDKFDIFNGLSEKMNNDRTRLWKKEGRPVVGLTCSGIPEEIVHSAGILPVRIRANSVAETECADAELHKMTCSYIKAASELLLADKNGFFDGVIAVNTCDHHLNLTDLLYHKSKIPLHYFEMRHSNTAGGRDLFIKSMKKLIVYLQDQFAVSITASDIRNSIKIYNQTRALMDNLNEFRKSSSPLISGAEYMKIVRAGMTVRKEAFNVYLEDLITELSTAKSGAEQRPRVMIMGGACDSPDFISFVEEQGFFVTADNLCFGARHYHGQIDVEARDLLSAIAERYFQAISCPSVVNDFERNYNLLTGVLDKMEIQGIIVARIKFCDHYAGFVKMLKDALAADNRIRVLDLEKDYGTSGSAQLATRLQAFHEMIGNT